MIRLNYQIDEIYYCKQGMIRKYGTFFLINFLSTDVKENTIVKLIHSSFRSYNKLFEMFNL